MLMCVNISESTKQNINSHSRVLKGRNMRFIQKRMKRVFSVKRIQNYKTWKHSLDENLFNFYIRRKHIWFAFPFLIRRREYILSHLLTQKFIKVFITRVDKKSYPFKVTEVKKNPFHLQWSYWFMDNSVNEKRLVMGRGEYNNIIVI